MGQLEPRPPAKPERRSRWPARLVGIAALAVLVWLLVGPALGVVRAAIAFAGYVLVGVVSYFVGKWVGRHSAPR